MTDIGREVEIVGMTSRLQRSYSLGPFSKVFQLKMFAIVACLTDNILRGYTHLSLSMYPRETKQQLRP